MQPHAEVMPGDLGRPPGPQPAAILRSLPVQAQGMPPRVVDRCAARTDSHQPAPPGLRPWAPTLPRRRTEDRGSGGLPPPRLVRRPRKAFLDHLRATGGGSHARPLRLGRVAPGPAGGRQGVGVGPGRANAHAGQHPSRGDHQPQRAPCIPAQAVPPAPRRPAGPLAGPAPLGLPRRAPGARAGCREAARGRQAGHEGPHKGPQRLGRRPQLAVTRLPRGPRRQGRPPVTLGLAIQAPRPAPARPRPDQSHSHACAPAARGLWPRGWLRGQGDLATSIDQDVKSRQEGGHLNQRSAPDLGEESALLPAGGTFRVSSSCQLTPSV